MTHENGSATTTMIARASLNTPHADDVDQVHLYAEMQHPFLKLDVQSTVLRVFHQSMYSHLSC